MDPQFRKKNRVTEVSTFCFPLPLFSTVTRQAATVWKRMHSLSLQSLRPFAPSLVHFMSYTLPTLYFCRSRYEISLTSYLFLPFPRLHPLIFNHSRFSSTFLAILSLSFPLDNGASGFFPLFFLFFSLFIESQYSQGSSNNAESQT